MKAGCLWVLALAAVAAPAGVRADVASAYGQIGVGGAGGKGLSGARQDESFHRGARGAAYGLLAGVEVLFVDVWIQHDQYRGSDGLVGTWTQFMTGFDVEVDLGERKGGATDAKGNVSGGYASSFAEIGSALGFGVGTGRQVEPPLDSSEISDKGFLLQGAVAFGWRATRQLSLGISVPVQVGYMIKSGEGTVANDEDNQYLEFNIAAMLNLRFKLAL